MNVRNWSGQYGLRIFSATAAGAVGAFADMTGEGTAVTLRRVLVLTSIKASGAGAFSFAIRANDGATTRVLYPESGDLVRIGDGIRYLIDNEVEIRVEKNERLQWISAEGVAKEVTIIARDLSDTGQTG